jgi:hypothetical protein
MAISSGHKEETETMKSTRILLWEFTAILNRFGVGSDEAKLFIEENSFNSEFVELAKLSENLKNALVAPSTDHRDGVGCGT